MNGLVNISNIIQDLSLNVTANFIYDLIRKYLRKNKTANLEDLKNTLATSLKIEGASIKAERIIEFLATNGDIIILGTKVYATDKIEISSSMGTSFTFGNNSTSETKNTKIETRGNASITGRNGAKIIQQDKSIKFSI